MATFITVLALCLPRVTAHPLYFASPSETLGPSEPSFVPDPTGRGTVSLLLSCIITLTLCIWTVVHLNIIPNTTPTRYLALKLAYLLAGLFAPEAVLALAIVECIRANTLRKTAKYAETNVIVDKEVAEAEGITDKVLEVLEALWEDTDPIIEEVWEAARVAKGAAATAKDIAKEAENAREEALAADKKKYEEVVAKSAKEAEEAKAKAKAKEVEDAGKEVKNGSGVDTEPGRLDPRESASVTKAPDPNDVPEAQPVDVDRPTTNAEDADTGATTIQGGNWAEVEKKQYAALLAAELTKSAATRASLALERAQPPVTPGVSTRSWVSQKLGPFLPFYQTCWEFLAPSQTRENGFGMAGSFFAVMGGYTFLPFGEDPVERPKMPALTLSPRGLAFLLRAGIVTTPKLAALQGEVADKGNANVLAKLIVCAQALWMVVNCICRKATGLPVTLIELNVAMHVACAVMVYGFWWKKPLDAGRAIPLSSSFLRPGVCALLAMIYWESCGKGSLRALKEKPEEEPPIGNNGAIMPTPSAEPQEYEVLQNKTSLRVSGDFPKQNDLPPWTIQWTQRLDGEIILGPGETLVNPIAGFEYTSRAPNSVFLTKHDLELFEQATNELRSPEFPYLRCSDDKPYPLFPFSSNLFNPPINLPSWTSWGILLLFVDTDREREMVKMATAYPHLSSPEIKLAALVILTLFVFYGGVHATAWNSHFPTLTERRIWRAACVITGAPGAVLAILCGLGYCIYWIGSKLPNRWRFLLVRSAVQPILRMWNWFNIGGQTGSNPRWVCGLILFLVFPSLLLEAVIILYVGARFYIVVESFISVRSLPEGAFKTVRWGDFWPHL